MSNKIFRGEGSGDFGAMPKATLSNRAAKSQVDIMFASGEDL